MKSKAQLKTLYTPYAETMSEIPWDIYPRPKLKRNSYICLNGKWDFGVKGADGSVSFDKQILVPFCPESALSGIQTVYPPKTVSVYRKVFSIPENFNEGRVLLHFGGVDQSSKVFVNGNLVCENNNGYIPFSVDITAQLTNDIEIVVEVTDDLTDKSFPYGKQRIDRGGMWYTPVSGIWQTVWIESVPDEYIKNIKTDVKGSSVKITLDGATTASVKVYTPDGEIEQTTDNGEFNLDIPSPVFWDTENPYLYYYEITAGKDRVISYFALRELSVKTVNGVKRLCLNGKPIFFHGLLDQGYFSDGIFTPASPKAYTDEILKVKALGFNTLRKHIKIEPQFFYYECDRLGMLVWQDMVNNGDYKFIRDTALPTLGFIRKNDRRLHKNKLSREKFVTAMIKTVELLKEHPCICYWTIFNEGWGQFNGDENYKLLKSLDDTRFIDATSGWFINKLSDVVSRHIYFGKIKFKPKDRPLVLSEFGGAGYRVDGHVSNEERSYGYSKCVTREDFVKKTRELYIDYIIPAVKDGLCGAIYTQVSDVEDEINGLFTYDRKVDKLLPDEFNDISRAVYNALK